MGREAGFLERFIAEWRQWETRVVCLSILCLHIDSVTTSELTTPRIF